MPSLSKKSPEQVYALLIQAGATPAAATTLTAIAGAESAYDDRDLGDVNLENGTWGPSYGLFQIRTLKNKTGTGDYRDVQWLAASDLNQAKAALAISAGGTNFTPWTTYTSGKYQSFLSAAKSAATAGGAAVADVGGFVTSTVADWVAPLVTGLRSLGLTGAFAMLGAALIIGGAYVTARPTIKATRQAAAKTAVTVAKAVV